MNTAQPVVIADSSGIITSQRQIFSVVVFRQHRPTPLAGKRCESATLPSTGDPLGPMNPTMQQPPSDDPKKARKPAIRPRHHVPGGPAGSPQHALTRLDEAERLERALLHELAGLLDGSTRFLRLAQRELRSSPSSSVAAAAAINHLAAAESALNTMAGMVQQTREVANDRPHPRYMVAPQPVHVAIDAAVAHTQHLAAEHGVRVAINLDASALSAPPLPIYPVIANALRNAIDAHRETSASDPNPEISVDAWCDELESLHICVRDNGVGLSDELRSDPSLAFSLGYTERRGGSGVGLALSADIVAALGGTIRLDAQASGGAKLSITIPIGTKHDPREQTDG